MNSLDFYLAQLFGCKRDVARVAGKVGGLTEVFFTGLCGALPEAKGKIFNFFSEFEQFGTDFEVYLLVVIFKKLSHVRQRI